MHPDHRDWAAERARMVRTQLVARGVASERVLDALGRVPRERFVPAALRAHAYQDRALAIGRGQTISQPYIVALMTASLEMRGDERVLEVGTGSGYQTAVLAELAAGVWSVERVGELAVEAARILDDLGYHNVRVRRGDGSRGWPGEAPFDRIIVTAAAPAPPPSLLDQLSDDGGLLVAPVGGRELQQLAVVERQGTEFITRRTIGCRFVPLLGEEGWPE